MAELPPSFGSHGLTNFAINFIMIWGMAAGVVKLESTQGQEIFFFFSIC